MNQMKKISKNITSNMMKKMRLQYVRTSLAKITAVMVVTMTVLAQSLIAEAQEAEPDITRDMRALEQNGVYLTGLPQVHIILHGIGQNLLHQAVLSLDAMF